MHMSYICPVALLLGPFVMNSQEEVFQAFEDYRDGKNGFERASGWTSQISQEA